MVHNIAATITYFHNTRSAPGYKEKDMIQQQVRNSQKGIMTDVHVSYVVCGCRVLKDHCVTLQACNNDEAPLLARPQCTYISYFLLYRIHVV